MYEPITVDINPDATVANVSIPIAGKTTDRESDAALALLREEIVPETVGRLPNTETVSPDRRPSGRTRPTSSSRTSHR